MSCGRAGLAGRTAELERLAVEMFARGLSTRDIEAAFRDSTGATTPGRSAVSQVTVLRHPGSERTPVAHLFVEGAAERLHAGRASPAPCASAARSIGSATCTARRPTVSGRRSRSAPAGYEAAAPALATLLRDDFVQTYERERPAGVQSAHHDHPACVRRAAGLENRRSSRGRLPRPDYPARFGLDLAKKARRANRSHLAIAMIWIQRYTHVVQITVACSADIRDAGRRGCLPERRPAMSFRCVPSTPLTFSRITTASLMRVSLLALCLVGFGGIPAYAQSITYVANAADDTVSVIYTATHEIFNPPVRDTISVKPAGDLRKYTPVAVAFTPYRIEGNANGQYAYVVNTGVKSVSVIDTAKGALVGTPIPVGTKPVAIAVSGVCLNPTGGACNPKNPLQGTYAYVVNYSSNSITIIDTDPNSPKWNKPVKHLAVGKGPSAIAVTTPILEQAVNGMVLSAGFYVYVTNSLDNTVSVIDADSRPATATSLASSATFHTVVKTIPLGPPTVPPPPPSTPSVRRIASLPPPPGKTPVAIAFDRTSRWAYVVNAGSGNVTCIDTTTHTVTDAIKVGTNPAGIAVTRDYTGSFVFKNFRAYVTNKGSHSFSVIDIEPGSPTFQTVVTTTPLKIGDAPQGVSVMYPDEDFVYITNSGSKSVSVIDSDPDSDPLQYNKEVGRVAVGGVPKGIANTPRIPYAYVANSGSNSISVVGASPQIGDAHPVLARIPLGFSPSWMALHRNQDFLFIADRVGKKLHVVNTISLEVVGSTVESMEAPVKVAMPPDGCCTYVTGGDNVYAIDTDDAKFPNLMRRGIVLNACKKPQGLDVHPDEFLAYVACTDSNEVIIIDVHQDLAGGGTPSSGANNGNAGSGQNQSGGGSGGQVSTWNTIVGRIPLPRGPIGVGMTHFGHRAFVLNSDNTVSIIDTKLGSTTRHQVLITIPVGRGPAAVAFNELDTHAYVTNSLDGTVSVIELATNTVVKTIPVGSNPQDIFINLGERTAAYVANKGDGTVSLIDVQKGPTFNTVLDTVTVEAAPIGLIITEP